MHEIEQDHERLGVHARDCEACSGADAGIVDMLSEAAEHPLAAPEGLRVRLQSTIPAASERSHMADSLVLGRRIVLRRILVVAAAAAVLGIAVLVPIRFDGSTPAAAATYEAAVTALRSAPSVHVRWYVRNSSDGGLALESESWYSRAYGVRIEEGGGRKLVVQRPEVEWSVFENGRVAVRRPPGRPAEMRIDEIAEKMFLKYADRAQPHPDGDLTIGGERCRLFVAVGDAVTTQPAMSVEEAGKVFLWVDNDGAVRRSEFHAFGEDTWHIAWRRDADFEARIGPRLFETPFLKTHRIIDPEQVLYEMFDLQRADAVWEVNQMIVALHDTVRVPGVGVAATLTLRPTEQTRKLLRETTDARLRYSQKLPVQMVNVLSVPGAGSVLRYRVGDLRERAMQVKWLIFPSESEDGSLADEIDIRFMTFDRTDGKCFSALGGWKQSVPARHLLATTDRPRRDIADVAQLVYDQMSRLADFRPHWLTTTHGDPFSDGYSNSHAISFDDYTLRIDRERFCKAVIEAFGRDE